MIPHSGPPFPTPDPGWPTNPTVNAVFTVAAAVPVLVGLAAAGRLLKNERNPIGLVCILGGALASLVEPLVTYVGYVHYPPRGQWTVFTGFGESIPLFLTLAYTAEIGVGSFVVWRLLRGGGGPRSVLTVWWWLILGDLVLETLALRMDVFYYYGSRPLDLFGFPLYWAPLDATLALFPGVLLYLFHRRDWRLGHYLVVLGCYPVNVMVVYLGAGWPIFTLQHAQVADVWLWLVAPVTLLTCYLMARTAAAISVLPPEAVERLRSAARKGRSYQVRAARSTEAADG